MTSQPLVITSVVIPAYRERGRIASTVSRTRRYFESIGVPWEVVVVDDGSGDGTADEAAGVAACDDRVRCIRLDAHKGKGAAVKAGIAAAAGSLVLLVDADLAIPLEEYPSFVAAIASGADVVIGSKELGRRSGIARQPALRTLSGRVFNFAVRTLLLPDFLDTQAGFKLMKARAAGELAARCLSDGFAYDVEMLAVAGVLGYRVVELPVHCRLTSRTSVRVLRDSLGMLRDLLAIRRRVRRMTHRSE